MRLNINKREENDSTAAVEQTNIAMGGAIGQARYSRFARYFMLFVAIWFAVLPTAQVLAAAGGTPAAVLATRIAPGETASIIDGPNGFQIVLFLLGGVEVSRVESGTPNTGGGGGNTGGGGAALYLPDAIDQNLNSAIPGANGGDINKDLGIPPAGFNTTVIGGNNRPGGPFGVRNPPPAPPGGGNKPPVPPAPPEPPVKEEDPTCGDCLKKLQAMLARKNVLEADIRDQEDIINNSRDSFDELAEQAPDADLLAGLFRERDRLIEQESKLKNQQIEIEDQQEQAKVIVDRQTGDAFGVAASTVQIAGGIALVTSAATSSPATLSFLALTGGTLGGLFLLGAVLVVTGAVLLATVTSILSPTGRLATNKERADQERRRQEIIKERERIKNKTPALDKEIREVRERVTRFVEAKQSEIFDAALTKLKANELELFQLIRRIKDLFKECKKICPPGTKITQNTAPLPGLQRVVAVAAKPATTRTNFNAKSNRKPYQPVKITGNTLVGKFNLREYRNSLTAAGQRNDGGPLIDLPGIFGDERFNMWISPSLSFSENTSSGPNQGGVTISIGGGVSWKIAPTINLGLVARYANTDLKGAGSKTNSDTWSTGAFIQAMIAEQVNLSITGTYSHSSVDGKFTQAGVITSSNSNADAFSGQASLSRSFKMGEYNISPSISASYVHLHRKAFTMSDGTFIGDQKSNSLTFSGGPSISRTFVMEESDIKVTPSLGLNVFINASRVKSFLDANGIRRKSGNYGMSISTGLGFKAPSGISWAINGGFSGSQGGQRSYSVGGNLSVPLN